MKTIKLNMRTFLTTLFMLVFIPAMVTAQERRKTDPALDQNISIYAEEEPLSGVIEKICKYLNIDYSYNADLIANKR